MITLIGLRMVYERNSLMVGQNPLTPIDRLSRLVRNVVDLRAVDARAA